MSWAGISPCSSPPAQTTPLAPWVITPLDTTACGDAFAGAFAAALEEGAALARAVRFGNAAGALAALTRGAQPSLPRRDAILARLALSP